MPSTTCASLCAWILNTERRSSLHEALWLWCSRGVRVVIALAVLGTATGCSSLQRGESLDPTTLPTEVRGDYEVFANRCSRCHPLARPLNARVSEDSHWRLYVARMRRMPGSGITLEDTPKILNFLYWWRQHHDDAPRTSVDGGRR